MAKITKSEIHGEGRRHTTMKSMAGQQIQPSSKKSLRVKMNSNLAVDNSMLIANSRMESESNFSFQIADKEEEKQDEKPPLGKDDKRNSQTRRSRA
jgi:hypothetical protein